jgi:hypothetical protein
MKRGIVGALVLFVVSAGCNKRLVLVDADDTKDAAAGTPVAAAAGTGEITITVDAGSAAVAVDAGAATVKPTGVAAAPGGTFPATCAGTCEKTLRCLGSFNASEQASCIAQCQAGSPDPARFARLNKMDCATLTATLKGGSGGSSSGGGAPEGPCGKQHCATCVFDGTSCYSRVPPFLACDACCCRPGGPAPRWE